MKLNIYILGGITSTQMMTNNCPEYYGTAGPLTAHYLVVISQANYGIETLLHWSGSTIYADKQPAIDNVAVPGRNQTLFHCVYTHFITTFDAL